MTRQWYSLKEVAAMFGLTPQSVHRKVQEGRIPCDKSLGPKCWRIPAAWCENPAGYTQLSTVVGTAQGVTSGDVQRREIPSSLREKGRKK